MLDLEALKNAISERNVKLPDLAAHCDVSAELLAGWLAGEIIPRPNKLQALCEFLGLAVHQALTPARQLAIHVAYAPPESGPVDGREPSWVADMAGCLMSLAPLARATTPLAPPRLLRPSLDPNYVARVAAHFSKMGQAEDWGLLQQLRDLGAIVIPLVGNPSSPAPGSASFYHVDSGRTFVTVNLSAPAAEIRDALAFHLGASLVFPCAGQVEPTSFGAVFARAICHRVPVTLDPDGIRCGPGGDAAVTPEAFVSRCISVFGSSYLEALAEFQSLEGGRNPAFVQLALHSTLLDAVGISFALQNAFEFNSPDEPS